MARLFSSVLLSLSVCAAAWAASPPVLVDADFSARPVTVLAMDEKGVRVSGPDGAAPQLRSWDNLLEVDFAPPHVQAATRPTGFVLYLNGGDRLLGSPISITDDTVGWQQSGVGRIDVPEDRVNAIVRAGQSEDDLTLPRKADVVRLINGDATTGVIESMGDSTVTIHPTDATVSAQISLDKVAAILLADPDPTAAASGRSWRIWLSDGSYLTVPVARIAAGDASKLILGFTDQDTWPVDLAVVAGVEQTQGPVRWLTDLTPTAVVYHPFFDESFPPQFDHPVDDPGVTIRGAFPPYRHGIGVHSYTKLTYAVPEGFAAFRTQFEVERIAGSDMTKADLNVRILADGQVARQFDHVRYGAAAEPVTIDVAGKKEISLEVDFGDNSPAQGRFLWLDPAFLRAVPATQPAGQ